MKKLLSFLCMCTLLLSLCACGSRLSGDGANADGFSGGRNETDTVTGIGAAQSQNGLSLLTHEVYPSCNTEDGYYYIPSEPRELRDGSYGSAIMYMDFATQQEVYLCNNAGCSHDTVSCNAIIPEDEFSPYFGTIFTSNGKLYLLSCGGDSEGETITFGYTDSGMMQVSTPNTLYRMNLDGTNREKVYTFPDGVTVELTVLGNGSSLYFITKELSQSGGVTTASNRQLMRYDISSGKTASIASLNVENGSHWRIVGCSGSNVVLEGVAYPEGYSAAEDYSASQWSEIFSASKTKYVCLNVENVNFTSLYDVKNKNGHGAAVLDGALYVAEGSSENILRIDLESGDQSTLASLEQSNIIGTMGTMLVCCTWDMTENFYLYFVDTESGAVSRCTLTNKYNGWALELVGETQKDAVVIYDYDAEALSDGAYEIYRYKMALISKSDLCAGNDNFRPIAMIAGGR